MTAGEQRSWVRRQSPACHSSYVRLPECTVSSGSPDAHHGGIWKMGGYVNCGDLRLVTHFGQEGCDQRCTKKPKLLGYLSFLFKSGRFN